MTPRYLLRRLVQVFPAVAGIVLIAFVAIHTAPGDPVLALAGEHGDAAYYAFIRAKFALDRPLPEQLAVYVSRVVSGDLGLSFVHGRPVALIIAERLPATLLLIMTALTLSTITGIALGVLAARRAGRPADLALRTGALLAHATPSFWLAQMAAITLALGTGWFPVQGLTDARRALIGWRYALDIAHHLVLPAVVLAAGELALTTRLTRAGVLEALATDYTRTARAKGCRNERGPPRAAQRATAARDCRRRSRRHGRDRRCSRRDGVRVAGLGQLLPRLSRRATCLCYSGCFCSRRRRSSSPIS
jgi:peptide/nickel transport system permease protein